MKSWEEFEEQVCRSFIKKGDGAMLFRGQPNGRWKLESTLYRKCDDYILGKYLYQIGDFYNKAKVFADLPWNLDVYDFGFSKWKGLVEASDIEKIRHLKQIVEYMVYLRHHGYPSPLLDWSRSPYVAAFFACCQDSEKADTVAIFQYQQSPNGIRCGIDCGYDIRVINYPIETHRRHYLQQSCYIVALKTSSECDEFCSYEKIAEESNEEAGQYGSSQDVIIKYTLPKSERKKILNSLDAMNISYLSLFGDEQALIDTLALQIFELGID